MNYEQARKFLNESERYGGEMGLERISRLLDYLGHPEQNLSFVHIAGTNGKGSVLACVSTALSMGGYRIGRYISPTLYSYEERFQIDGCPISKETYALLMGQVADGVAQMEKEGYVCPSPFELETVLAFLYFAAEKCDLVVMECGMGGKKDATNVIEHTVLAAIVSVSMDHMEYLGDTLEEIAAAKAGIIKPGAAVVTPLQKPSVLEVIQKACQKYENTLTVADYQKATVIQSQIAMQEFEYGGDIWTIHMGGIFQIENAVVAIEILKALAKRGYPLTREQMQEGMAKARWNGRFTLLGENPVFLVDGAHNPDAANKFVKSLLNAFAGHRIIYIMGIFRDKAYKEIVRITVPHGQEIITIQPPDTKRGLPAAELAEEVRHYSDHVHVADSIEEAVRLAYSMAGSDDVIAAFGSLSFIGPLTECVKKYQGEKHE